MSKPLFKSSRRAVLSLIFGSSLFAGRPASTIEIADGRRDYAVRAVVTEALREEQSIADAFFGEGLLPERVNAMEVPVWKAGR